MLVKLAYYQILDKPLFLYFGLLALVLMISAATLAWLIRRGRIRTGIAWHMELAKAAIVAAVIHAALGLSAYF